MNRTTTEGKVEPIRRISLTFMMWIISLCLPLSFTGSLPAHASGKHKGPDAEEIMGDLTEKLSLTPDQVEQIRPIIELV